MRKALSLASVAVLLSLASCLSWKDIRARNAYDQGKLDYAEELTTESLARDPKDLQARKLGAKIATKRGVEAMEHGNMAKAKEYFEKAVELNPTDDVAQKYRAFFESDALKHLEN